MDNDIRLVKFLSTYAGVSRRAAGDLVKNGCVTVDGTTVTEPGMRVTAENRITLNGVPVAAVQRKYYIMLNKPRGYVSTNADPHAEKKAVDLIGLPDAPRLFSAGRLDKESEGMLLFSNDGDYVAALTHPRNEILKTYIIQLRRELTPNEISKILNGIEDGELTAEAQSMVDRLLKTHFRPEFLNRIDEIVTYKPLTKEQIGAIVNLMLASLNKRLADKQLRVELTDAAMNAVIEQGFDPAFGARPLKRYLQSKVETLVAKRIIAADVKPGDVLTVDADADGKLFVMW